MGADRDAAVDFRRGADGLATVVQTVLRQNPFSGTIYVFRCKRADRVKLLVSDGSGLVLIWKRLETSAFKWPPVTNGVIRLSAAQGGARAGPKYADHAPLYRKAQMLARQGIAIDPQHPAGRLRRL